MAFAKQNCLGTKGQFERIVEKAAGGLDRLTDTYSKEQASLPQHPSCMGDTPYSHTARDTPHFCNPFLGRQVGATALHRRVRPPARLQSLLYEPNSASTWKTNEGTAFVKPHAWVAGGGGTQVPMPKSSDNSINTSTCDQKVILQRGLLPHSPPSISQSPGPGSPGTCLAGSTTSTGAEAAQAPTPVSCVLASDFPLVTWGKGKADLGQGKG